jgi:hypothetical protein
MWGLRKASDLLLFGSACLLFLRTLDALRAATDERAKRKPAITDFEKRYKSNFLYLLSRLQSVGALIVASGRRRVVEMISMDVAE